MVHGSWSILLIPSPLLTKSKHSSPTVNAQKVLYFFPIDLI